MTRSEKFIKLQRKMTVYLSRKAEAKSVLESLMVDYIKKSRELKSELDLMAGQIELLLSEEEGKENEK